MMVNGKLIGFNEDLAAKTIINKNILSINYLLIFPTKSRLSVLLSPVEK